MTKSRVIAVILAILLLAGGTTLHLKPEVLDAVSWSFSTATVKQAIIVEESSERSKLPQSQIIAIQKASSIGILVIDKDAVGPDGKTPPEFVALLNACKDKPLPLLVRKWSNGRTTAVALPLTFDKLKEAK